MIPKEAIEAACAALNKRDRGNAISIPDVVAILTAAFAAMPGPAVNGAGNMPLIQALSRMAGNRQPDGTSSLVGREDRETIINWCHGMLVASWSALTPAPDLASENDRLRAALEKVAGADFLDFSLAPERSAVPIARAALERT